MLYRICAHQMFVALLAGSSQQQVKAINLIECSIVVVDLVVVVIKVEVEVSVEVVAKVGVAQVEEEVEVMRVVVVM